MADPEGYPNRLIPKLGYQYIDDFSPLASAYLQRNMPAEFRLENGDVDAAKVAPQSGHLADFSTNLVGIFLPEDRRFQLTEIGSLDYGQLWLEGSKVDEPNDNHFYIDETLAALFLRIGDVPKIQVPYNVGEQGGFTAMCEVRHTPIRGNFWHVSLRWINQEGDVLNQRGGWRKRMLTAARALLAEVMEEHLPVGALNEMDASIYKDE